MGYIMGYIKIGKGIKAIFDKNTGSVKLYSNNGILQRNWIEHLGVGTEQIKSISTSVTPRSFLLRVVILRKGEDYGRKRSRIL